MWTTEFWRKVSLQSGAKLAEVRDASRPKCVAPLTGRCAGVARRRVLVELGAADARTVVYVATYVGLRCEIRYYEYERKFVIVVITTLRPTVRNQFRSFTTTQVSE